MPTVHVEASLSAEQMLQAVQQFDTPELEAFTRQVLALRARRQTPVLAAAEAALLARVNAAVPEDDQRRYEELIRRRQEETLTSAEQKELIQLGDQVELREADRLQALVDLARLRQMSLGDLLRQLGLDGKFDG